MLMKRILKVTAVLLFICSVSGCGNEGNSNTNGTLSLTAVAPVNAGTANLTAIAAVTSGRAEATLIGIPVNFSAVQYPLATPPLTESGVVYTDQAGAAEWVKNFPQQTYATTLEVTANSGGIYKTVRIPVAAIGTIIVPSP